MNRLLAFILLTISLSSIRAQTPNTFKNPILPGFYPDPSICRVGDTYYMVNSSFEWFPGLPIHKSKDLVNWETIGHGLHRPDQMIYKDGLDNSLGVFAPTIRYHKGKYYIITTMVGQGGNFIITAKTPEGPWSDPIWIKHAPGIDPSLFWDDDEKCYYTGAGIIDGSKKDWPGKGGIWMQEIDPNKGVLMGEPKQLTHGHASNARWAEGPHLYKINGEYLLLIGEGGTGEYHAVTVFNSKNIWGPYVPNHANPVITHRHLKHTHHIGQVGHADLVQTQNGDWWSVMLAKRHNTGFVTLARETFLAKVEITMQESGVTPIFNPGFGLLQDEQERPNLPWTPVKSIPERDEFDAEHLGLEWNFLRTPKGKWHEQKDGKLNIKLRPQVLTELVNPSFIGQRTRHFNYTVKTKLSFNTLNENEKSGLVIYRRHGNNYQLLKGKNNILLLKTLQKDNKGDFEPELIASVPYTKNDVILSAEVQGTKVQFFYGENEHNFHQLGALQDYTILSDEIAKRFNGVYAGMYATANGEQSKKTAQFDWFEMKESKPELNIGAIVQPVPEEYKFINPDYHIWGASVVKGYDGLYHMYYSRWKYELGHMGWVTDSEVAYAVSDKAEGPYKHVNVALPARGNEFWDGTTTHNPTVIKKDDKYYLYYMGTTSHVKAKQPTSMNNKDWWIYRNNQRIGVAWSDNPAGPWNRLDKPVIDISDDPNAPDALMTSNPAINIAPDGKIFAVYKAVGKQEGWKPVNMESTDGWQVSKGDRVRYMVAFADNPLGPFKKEKETVFELKGSEDEHMIAEDPFVWSQDGKYYAIVTDIKGRFTNDAGALALMESTNGMDWQQAKHPLVLPSKILKTDGTRTEYKIERPQLLLENGVPTFLFGALGITVNGVHRGHACNLRIKLNKNNYH